MTLGGGTVKDKERRKSLSVGRASGSLPYKDPCGTEGYGRPDPPNELCWQVQCEGLLPLETLLDRAKSSRLQKGVLLLPTISFLRVHSQNRGSA